MCWVQSSGLREALITIYWVQALGFRIKRGTQMNVMDLSFRFQGSKLDFSLSIIMSQFTKSALQISFVSLSFFVPESPLSSNFSSFIQTRGGGLWLHKPGTSPGYNCQSLLTISPQHVYCGFLSMHIRNFPWNCLSLLVFSFVYFPLVLIDCV